MATFVDLSRELARVFGESRARTTSRVMGTGLCRLSGGALGQDSATQIVHAAMLTGVTMKEARGPVGVALLATYIAGLDDTLTCAALR